MLSLLLSLSTVACTEITWTQKTGSLKQIQAGPLFKMVCGVNNEDNVYCASTGTFDWYQLPGKLSHVTTAYGKIYGVNADNNIYYSASNQKDNTTWVQLPGKLRQISFDGKTICGTNSEDHVFCADKDITTNPNWFRLPGLLKEVVVRGEELFGVSDANLIYYSPSFRNAVWTNLPGRLAQIQYDGTRLCGVNADDNIFCATQYLTTAPNWQQLSGKLRVVSFGGTGQLTGVSASGAIYTGQLPFY